jgi:ribosome-associated protein
MPTKNSLKQQVQEAILACQDKQADQLTILELEKESGAFTDYFVMCSGTNPRQIQAIADAVEERLEQGGMRVTHKEGYKQAEWVLLDYVDFVVHIFSQKAREFYDLERLWKSARRIEAEEFLAKPRKRAAKSKAEMAPNATVEMASEGPRKHARKKRA